MAKIRYQTIGDRVVTYRKLIVYRTTADVEDIIAPEIHIDPWLKTEAGKFISKHSTSPLIIHKDIQFDAYNLQIAVEAELEEKKLTEYYLKFGKN